MNYFSDRINSWILGKKFNLKKYSEIYSKTTLCYCQQNILGEHSHSLSIASTKDTQRVITCAQNRVKTYIDWQKICLQHEVYING